jgi:acetylornithine deacetylase/succinyl-diaminopimelate desuccinylase-like protein
LVKGSEGATVITFFQKKKIPAVATGWGASGCAHATDEYARAADLYQGAIVLERAIKLFDSRRESC